jgi:hypothetical protein
MSLDIYDPSPSTGGTPPVADTTLKSLTLTPDALTGSSALSALSITQTWNTTGVPTAFNLNVTDTASNAGSLLMALQVGGVNKAEVDKSGNAVFGLVALRSPNAGYFNRAIVRSTSDSLTLQSDARIQFTGVLESFSTNNIGITVDPTARMLELAANAGINFSGDVQASGTPDLLLRRAAVATLQLGTNHATTTTTQTIKAHDVVTGEGAGLVIEGGDGSTAKGPVILDGGNRSAYDTGAYSSFGPVVTILIKHGLMAMCPPISVSASDAGAGTATVGWTAEETGIATHYEVQTSLDGVSYIPSSTTTDTTASVMLGSDITIHFRVRSVLGELASDWEVTSTYVA